MLKRTIFVVVILLLVASPTLAQDHWGVSFAVTPSWQSGPGVKQLFTADQIDMQGSEFRFGFVRGQELSSEWGVSFVRTTIDND